MQVGNTDLRLAGLRLPALGARHAELSALLSADDEAGRPDGRLIELIPLLVAKAARAELPLLRERGAPSLVHVWPGEHYRLLSALLDVTQPKLVIEIGTYSGLSSLAMLPCLGPGAELVTFDLISWEKIDGTWLAPSDFQRYNFQQVIGDLGDPATARNHAALVGRADLVFVDAAKDGFLERRLLNNFALAGLRPGALIVFDDVRQWNMLSIWRDIALPKWDLASIGHFTGTGLVHWTGASPFVHGGART
jgi:predicted O-methyltransferase YrrM